MSRRCVPAAWLLTLGLMLPSLAVAQTAEAKKEEDKSKSKYTELIDKKKKSDGMWTLFHSDQKLLVEFSAEALRKEYIVIPSISKGISRGIVLGGMSWGFGDDVIWAFRKTDEKLFIVQRNVRFRAKPNSPEANAVELAYSDSIVHSMKIQGKSPSGGILVDMTDVFMNDDLQIGSEIGPGFRFISDRSTLSKVKAFPENVELQINAVYSGSIPLDTVPNPRGVQVGVHYSISVLPPLGGANAYKPRLADDRVGYFLTAIKDFSNREDPDHFVRYVNRWHLTKKDPNIDFSPPAKPIRFYMENTVPVFLRPTVRAGILEWNKAFAELGIADAIEVLQEPENDPDFDPENVHYNTFRWMTAEAGFAMGPSRVDPRTGQILDADIIFDASFLNSWSRRWETFRAEDAQELYPNWTPFDDLDSNSESFGHRHHALCTYCSQMQRQAGFAAAIFMGAGLATDAGLPKEFIHEGLKEVVMHEVGHTLGLRHNFKASSWKSLEEMSDRESGLKEGIVASVMDYAPPNITLDPKDQGLYYSQTLGPYDFWAIEYGYKIIPGTEEKELQKIASRSSEPQLAYTTDEDTRSYDPDPLSNRFDLGSDPLAFARRQMQLTAKTMPNIVERTVKDGEGYQRARQAFGLLFGEYWRAVGFAARLPGGIYVSRDHKGGDSARPPFQPVEAEKQREAMQLLAESAFAAPDIDGQQLNWLAASRWSHWGAGSSRRVEMAIHETVLRMQSQILSQVLNSTTLDRILETEFREMDNDESYTLAEHLDTIVSSIFSEWLSPLPEKEFNNRDPLIVSFRRNLQREAIGRMGTLVVHSTSSPSDARTLTRMHLRKLRNKAQQVLKTDAKLDDYTRAHLQDSVARIDAVLDASLTLPSAN